METLKYCLTCVFFTSNHNFLPGLLFDPMLLECHLFNLCSRSDWFNMICWRSPFSCIFMDAVVHQWLNIHYGKLKSNICPLYSLCDGFMACSSAVNLNTVNLHIFSQENWHSVMVLTGFECSGWIGWFSTSEIFTVFQVISSWTVWRNSVWIWRLSFPPMKRTLWCYERGENPKTKYECISSLLRTIFVSQLIERRESLVFAFYCIKFLYLRDWNIDTDLPPRRSVLLMVFLCRMTASIDHVASVQLLLWPLFMKRLQIVLILTERIKVKKQMDPV